ncbi:MAG: PH domain-containing protein [Planctomycetes bacterium]|nr:PH domain-containing protein [Planctomycetota bacterium]
MYSALKSLVLSFLRLPQKPPDPPKDGYGTVQVFRASRRWLTYRMVLFWIGAGMLELFALIAGIASLFSGKPVATVFIVLLAITVSVLLAVSWFCVHIEWDLRTYVVTDRSLRVRQGAWMFKEMTLTYANVQNVQVTQGPLQRVFGIEDLRVDTAGGGGGGGKAEAHGATGHNVTLAGLENAREVRDLILSYVKVAGQGSGLGDPDDPEHTRAGTSLASPAVVDALRSLATTTAALRTAVERRTRPI